MAYVALYRSYRPSTFSEVVGQKHVIKTLRNAVTEGKTSHAYIFSGLRGIGKTTIARILAKAVNCENPNNGEPCNACKNCLAIINDETADIVELDAASNNGVDEMREILEKVNFLPSMLRKKVYIIDEAHMLSSAAFNALLKTLEEPPLYVIFILATTEPHKIPQTILSRCQRFDFKQLSTDELAYQIRKVCEKEQIHINDDAVFAIAESAEGGMRDALSILDQASVYAEDTIKIEDVDNVTGRISKYKLIELVSSLKEKDANKAIRLTNELIDMGKEASRIVAGLIQFCRDLLLYKNVTEISSKKNIYNNEKFQNLADSFSEKELFYYIDVLVDIQNKIKFTNSQKIYIEVGLLKIINSAEEDIDILGKIQKIETQIGNGDFAGGYGNSDIDVKLASIENKVKKVAIDLEKADLENFKEKMESKIDLIEDVSSKNATLPTDVTMRFDSIEDRLRILSIDVKGSGSEEIKTLMEKVQELEQKFVEKPISNSEVNNPDLEVILEQLIGLENKVNILENNKIEEKNEMPIANSEEFVRLTEQFNQLKGVVNSMKNDSCVVQSLPLEENVQINSVLEEISVLKESVQKLSKENDNSNENNDNIEAVLKEIETLKEQMNAITNINSEESSTSTSGDVFERVSNIEKYIELVSQKVDEIEFNNDNEAYEAEVNELKENYFTIIAKLQEVVQGSSKEEVEKIREKVDLVVESANQFEEKISAFEERFKLIEQKDFAQDEQINLIKDKLINPQIVSQQTAKPVVTQQVTPQPTPNQNYNRPVEKKRVVETNENKTLQTVKNVYDVRIVERILHESRELECREQKGSLVSNWPKLEDKVGYVLAPIAKLLLDGKLAANGRKELLIVYPSATICNHLMEPKNYSDAKQVLRITFGRDYDFLALPENTWQEKRTEYIGQHGIGIRYPKLTPINNPELNVVIPNYDEINQKQKRPYQQARAFFGEDMVEEENK